MNMYTYERLETALCKAAKFLDGRDLVEFICKAEEIIDGEKNPSCLQRELELIAATRRTDMEMSQDNQPSGDFGGMAVA